jgi:acyl carrier protein
VCSPGSVRRKQADETFATELDALYTAFYGEGDSSSEDASPALPSENASSLSFVEQAVLDTLLSSAVSNLSLIERSLSSLGLTSSNQKTFAQLLASKLNLPISSSSLDPGASIASLVTSLAAKIASPFSSSNKTIDELIASTKKTLDSNDIDPSTSLFDQGLDSLLIHQLRREIKARIGKDVPASLIYEARSIEAIAQRVDPSSTAAASTSLSSDSASPSSETSWPAYAASATARFSGPFLSPPTTPLKPFDSSAPQIVLFSGATGALGCALLESLVNSPRSSIAKVICLVRAGSDAAAKKKMAAGLADKGYDAEVLLEGGNDGIVEVLGYDPSREDLGLETAGKYQELSEHVTSVIAVAWSVNFLRIVEDFEDNCVIRSFHVIVPFCA